MVKCESFTSLIKTSVLAENFVVLAVVNFRKAKTMGFAVFVNKIKAKLRNKSKIISEDVC